MTENQNTTGPTPAETLRGGLEITLNYVGEGTSFTAFIRQLPLGEMADLLAAQGDEEKLARLYTKATGQQDWPANWFESLTPESQERIVVEGDRINADFFGRWFRRRLARQERLVPGSTARILGAFETDGASPTSPPPRLVPAG